MPVLLSPSPSAEAAPRDRAGVLADLRARIRRIEGAGGEGGRILPFGIDAVDGHLPDGGLPLGCLHGVAAEDPGAGTGFAAALLARLATPRTPALWILRGRDLYAPGLAAYGLTPDRLVAVRAVRPVDALWAMEEALRSSALSAVLGELEGLDLTASRRLQLAAESSGVTGFLLDLSAGLGASGGRNRRAEGLSAAVTRWRLDAAPSLDGEEDAAPRPAGGPPGLGKPRWSVALERCRGGRPGHWTLSWDGEGWRDVGKEDGSGLGQAARSDSGPWPARHSIASHSMALDSMSDNRQGRLSDHRKPAIAR
ncbi:ImuA family protein [Azospirillum sp. CT11-132]|uniref:ImuA family protein n=1 Tax=Azospirillum sp. CT11-132 TaxID=3396317 RepID=UPI0039A41AB8